MIERLDPPPTDDASIAAYARVFRTRTDVLLHGDLRILDATSARTAPLGRDDRIVLELRSDTHDEDGHVFARIELTDDAAGQLAATLARVVAMRAAR
jgi:hypothetical protein